MIIDNKVTWIPHITYVKNKVSRGIGIMFKAKNNQEKQLVVNKIGIMMYKYANNLLPQVINDMYTTNSDVHNYTTRQKHLLNVNKSNINIYSKSYVNTSARIWNAMQSEIEVNVSISKFKISLKMY